MLTTRRILVLVVFLFAWSVRLAYVQEARQAGLGRLAEIAEGLVKISGAGAGDARDPAWGGRPSVLYDTALRFFERRGEEPAAAARVVQVLQAALGAATAALAALGAAATFGPMAGLAAGMMFAVAGPALFYEQRLDAGALEAFAALAALAAAAVLRTGLTPGTVIAACAALFAASAIVPGFAYAGLAAVLWIALASDARRAPGERRLAAALCFGAVVAGEALRRYGGPPEAVPVAGARVVDVLRAWEPASTVDYAFWHGRLGVVSRLSPSWLAVVPTALVAVATLARRWRDAFGWVAASAVGIFVLYGRYVDGSERIWIMAALTPLAGWGVVWLVRRTLNLDLVPAAAAVMVWVLAAVALGAAGRSEARPWDYLLAGELAERAGNLDQAGRAYAEGLRLDPDYPPLVHRLCLASTKMRAVGRALQWCAEGARLAPADPEILQALGTAYRAAGYQREALDAFLRARELAPDAPFIYENLAYLYVRDGEIDLARACIEEIVRLGRDGFETYYQLGLVLRLDGEPREALAAFQRAVTLADGVAPARRADAHVELARLLAETGEPASARLALARLLEQGFDRADVHRGLGLLYAREFHEPERALRHLERSLELDSDQRGVQEVEEAILEIQSALLPDAEPSEADGRD